LFNLALGLRNMVDRFDVGQRDSPESAPASIVPANKPRWEKRLPAAPAPAPR
jgi:hypothetical protein